LSFLKDIYLVVKSILTRDIRPEYREILDNFVFFSRGVSDERVRKTLASEMVFLEKTIALIETAEKSSFHDEEVSYLDLNGKELLFVLSNISLEKVPLLFARIKKEDYLKKVFRGGDDIKKFCETIRERFDIVPEEILLDIAIKNNFTAKELGG